jgi:ABC-2 type transport system ATP-binding protein
MDESSPAIDVAGLRKTYGDRVVIQDLSFTVAHGEILALLGPNGAGKTTTIEILEGYRPRDAGRVAVLGLDPAREASRLRRRIGVMLQEGGVYPQARPREILALLAAFYDRPAVPDELLALVGLDEARRTPYRRLSGGQKQRLALAMALVGQPELLFLDEPTGGLDPHARRVTWELIRSLRARGATVLLTTHAMDEAETLADRIGIIAGGRLVALGDLATLRGGDAASVRLVTAGPVAPEELRGLPSVAAARAVAPAVYLLETAYPAALLAEVTAWAVRRRVVIRELRTGHESLEEIFLRLTGAPQ